MKSSSNALGAGCLILFALPFAATGTVALVGCVRAMRNGTGIEGMIVLGLFGLVFSLVGYGLIFGALVGRKRVQRVDALRAVHPEQPWMWNEEWASRRISDSSRAGTMFLWLFTILWNGISAPLFFLIPREVGKENYVALVGLLFPLVGMILIVAAVRGTLRALRFRRSTLILDHLPVPLGGMLRGRVEVPYEPLADASSIIVRLTAISRTRSGKSTHESIVCQEDREVAHGSVSRTPDGVSIPISIDVPAGGSETRTDGNPQLRWRLTVDAEVPGIDYSATFDVPVFVSEAPQLRTHAPSLPPAEPREPADYTSKQTVEGRELYFRRFRARGMAAGVLLVTLAWSVIVGVLFVVEAPLFFSAVFGLFEVLFVWITLDLFFGTSTVILEREKVVLRRRLLGTRETSLRRDEIASAEAKIGAQGGGRPYYEVEVRTAAGKKLSAARYIRSKREAAWVAAQIRGALDSRP
jgi:hypothetical protein